MDNPNAVTTSPSGSTPAEAKAFLDAHPEIEAFDIVLTDANGIGRGKIVRRHELMGIFENGRHLPISILGLDITGEDVHETGLVWDTGDGDLRAWPIPGTLVPLYGTNPARGQVLMSMYHLDGQPMTSDPRLVLARQVELLAARGLHPAGAFELEFFLLSNERDADGKVQPARAVLDGRRSAKTEVYSVDHLHGMEPLFSDIYAAAKAQGIPAETVISEYAPGQYELTLNYRKDVMRAADDLVMLKRLVRAQARRHGVTACFMAKPIEAYAGSGMHFHVSLQDDDGRNVFTEAAGEKWSPKLLNALGGLIHTMAESMLVFAPHANSWRRFVSQSYAPVAPTWGVNNRSVALRVPAGDARNRRVEHRPSGVDANPYLVAATVLAGIVKGLDEGLDPGPETTGNGYEQPSERSTMPADWRAAIEAARGSDFLKSGLGPDLHRTFVAIKQAEYLRVARTVSELDYHLYLHEV
ncbi:MULTISPECIES: glutamine synthetase family protein [unclassified Mesorhizobium]|uniref:glutamine synthetase family protein n=1 Tax=unclassified Mesorhizobium TaxID=325217 RepID=UPI000F762C34|nr:MULTISPECIES: glutamine synthetase family protein [unclassified Mesorhizobium]AZO04747.1 glutamine synthetase [Mesorhizobium sp. M2A.F.Ca.ET.043.02.1.1]RUW71113.1 glutamine synthetase [Mesorhizobium sp. M2A.F.Ca.ET.067.02.1.1]RVC91025.1 glutamine synthetase [Mesorhizobium sp. M2A.F.Ca.ET.017.03.2.1]RVD10040.1 glutamine synthetase [Mesorhizobium sp. M2A.F.Ca.ET.029.05.1.1]RWB41417.1 MAG: glutamine synthetase [Mesorhizobium sp.]